MILRIWSRLAMIAVAIALLAALPISQLRTYSVEKSCCCPDPDNCHCPDHDAGPSDDPAIRACHNTQHAIATTPLAGFAPPAIPHVAVDARAVAVTMPPFARPHAAPPPRRPDAPS